MAGQGFAERLDGMRVWVESPDRKIVGELHGRAEVRLSFVPGSYQYYEEHRLEEQLAGLARLLWAARTREYYAARSEAFGETITGEAPPDGPRDVAFRAARDRLVAEGRSADGRIRLAVEGMRRWTIVIAPGTVRRMPEERFAAGVAEAAGDLIRDQFAKIGDLKAEIYD